MDLGLKELGGGALGLAFIGAVWKYGKKIIAKFGLRALIKALVTYITPEDAYKFMYSIGQKGTRGASGVFDKSNWNPTEEALQEIADAGYKGLNDGLDSDDAS